MWHRGSFRWKGWCSSSFFSLVGIELKLKSLLSVHPALPFPGSLEMLHEELSSQPRVRGELICAFEGFPLCGLLHCRKPTFHSLGLWSPRLCPWTLQANKGCPLSFRLRTALGKHPFKCSWLLSFTCGVLSVSACFGYFAVLSSSCFVCFCLEFIILAPGGGFMEDLLLYHYGPSFHF